MVINATISVSGRVQGVGYRNYVHMAANVLGIKGWVRNELDGTVTVEMEGQQAVVDEMIENCYHGSTLSRVDKIDIRQGEVKKLKDFKIIRM